MSIFPVIIGRSELIEFPELFLTSVPAKADTGAYRSAIHATNIKVIKKNGKDVLTFDLLAGHLTSLYSRPIQTTDFHKANVENSFGVKEERYATKLKIKLGTKVFATEFTLADRSKKPFPILIGRKTLNKRFLIDPSKSHIDRKELKKKFNIELAEDLEVIDP
ncbi:MAG: RimK/LysX family protein [bacterium]